MEHVRREHADPQAGGEVAVEVPADHILILNVNIQIIVEVKQSQFTCAHKQTYGNVLAALLEALRELRHDILVIVEQHPQQLAVLFDVVVALNLGEVVEDVEGTDVELVDGEYRGVAADDERKISETGDTVGDANGKLLAKVFGTPLRGRSKLI